MKLVHSIPFIHKKGGGVLAETQDSFGIRTLLFQFWCDEAVTHGARGGNSLDMVHVKMNKA